MNRKAVIFIGRSGCGKGTQSKVLTDYFKKDNAATGVLYIQTGLELRKFMEGTLHTQKMAKEVNVRGGLQPEFLTVYMWSHVFAEQYNGDQHVIIDGTPRKYHEAGVLNSVFEFYGIQKPYVIYLDIPKSVSVDRLLARKRADDTREDIEARLAWFETDVIPAIEYYRHNPEYHFAQIDGTRSVEDISKDIIAFIEGKA
jgi:adenylate kinase family enzyme